MYEGAVAKRVLQQPHNHRAIIKKTGGEWIKQGKKGTAKHTLGKNRVNAESIQLKGAKRSFFRNSGF
jgi:hypothetical protein